MRIGLNGSDVEVSLVKLLTSKGNLFISAAWKENERLKSFRFYLKPDLTRFFSPKEEENFNKGVEFRIPYNAWKDALEKWKNIDGTPVTAESPSYEELGAIRKLLPLLVENPMFCFEDYKKSLTKTEEPTLEDVPVAAEVVPVKITAETPIPAEEVGLIKKGIQVLITKFKRDKYPTRSFIGG